MPPLPVHLLLRFARLFQGYDTIQEHMDLLAKAGEVWFGKFGSPVGQIHIDRMNKQIAEGIPTYLYLVAGARGKYEVFQATVTRLQRQAPIKEKNLIPKYYANPVDEGDFGLWSKISRIEPLPADCLESLRVISSSQQVSEAIKHSMSGKFLVRQD